MKVLSIIGIVLSAIMVFATFLVVKSNGRMSIEEFAPWIFIYVLFMLTFSIVGIVKSSKSTK